MMKIFVDSRDFKKTVEFSQEKVILRDVLQKLGLAPENFIAAKAGAAILEDEPLRDNDRVRLFPVISGG